MVHVCVICVQVSNYVSGWWLQPLWKTWVRQLAKHESQYTESHKIPWFQTTNQIYIVIPMINHYLTIINHRLTRKIPWFQSPPYIWNTHCITWISETTGPPKKHLVTATHRGEMAVIWSSQNRNPGMIMENGWKMHWKLMEHWCINHLNPCVNR